MPLVLFHVGYDFSCSMIVGFTYNHRTRVITIVLFNVGYAV